MTGLWTGSSRVRSRYEKMIFLLFPIPPKCLWDPPSLRFNGFRRSFREVKRQPLEFGYSPPI